MVRFSLLLPFMVVVGLSACENRCGKDQNVGGGTAGLEVAAHVRVVRPDAIIGSEDAARHEVAELFGLDAFIVEQTNTAMPVDVLVGVGDRGVEVHTAMVAAGDAKERLAERYVLEPMMFQQLRIKPPHARTRCMLLSAHIACATGEARLGRGVMAVERLARQVDAGAGDALVGRVVTPAAFIDRVVPLARSHLEASLTRAKVPASLRALVFERDWNEIARWLAGAELTAAMRGDDLVLETTLPLSLPPSWIESAPRLKAAPELAALAWREREPAGPAALHAALGGGRATAFRVEDGARVALHELADPALARDTLANVSPSTSRMFVEGRVLTLSEVPEAGEDAAELGLEPAGDHAVARLTFDAALLGGAGRIEARVFRDGERARLEIAMTRPAFVALTRALAASWPDAAGQ